MKIRLRRPRELAVTLRDLARRRPREAEEYLDSHEMEWDSLVEADPQNAADILEALDEEAAADLLATLEPVNAAEVLEEMRDAAAADLLEELPITDAAALIAELPSDEAADIFEQLETDTQTAVLDALDLQTRDDLLGLLAYPADTAGGLMKTDPATLPIGISTGEAIEALRRLHEHLETMSYVYVVDQTGRLEGVVSFRELVFARPLTPLDEVMIPGPVAVPPETDREDVAEVIQRYGLLALPVVDAERRLLGIITVDDVLEAVQEEASEDIATMVGAGSNETVYTPVRTSITNRLPWVLVNLATAFLAAAVISRFEPVIERLTVLAAYMPVVASVGGNSGAQSQAVIIRALAIEAIPAHIVRRVLVRETTVALINGLVIGATSGLIATALTGNGRIGFVIGLAALVNMTVANLSGTGLPILLDRLGQDPALASNILLTTVTDLVGFGGFLAIATLLL